MPNKISGIIAPMPTPFVNEEVSLDHLRENVRKYAQTPLAGLFVLGSNGENKSLSEAEKLQVLETVLREKSQHQFIIAGIAAESTYLSIAAARQLAEVGADFISLLPPSYFKKLVGDEVLIRYYLDVADRSPVPVMAYNAPGFNGMTLSNKVVEEIAKHPNIAGMKDTSPGGVFGYLEISRGYDFDVLSGTVNTLLPALRGGATGGVVSLANAFPVACCELYQAVVDRRFEEADRINSRLLRLNWAVSGASGVAGVKYAMGLNGLYGGDPRLPLLPVKEADKERIRAAIAAAGIQLEKA
jgi:4-hydroxy-2-oxoglutarate aldolase